MEVSCWFGLLMTSYNTNWWHSWMLNPNDTANVCWHCLVTRADDTWLIIRLLTLSVDAIWWYGLMTRPVDSWRYTLLSFRFSKPSGLFVPCGIRDRFAMKDSQIPRKCSTYYITDDTVYGQLDHILYCIYDQWRGCTVHTCTYCTRIFFY